MSLITWRNILPYFVLMSILTLIYIIDAGEDNWSENERLRKALLKNYDKLALPQRKENDTTTVGLKMRLRSFWLDDEKQILTVNAWMALIWQDPRLAWDYKDYGNLQQAHFGDDELWKPDFHVYNNADISEVDHYGNVHFLVFSDGSVMWVPPASFKVFCPMDLRYWPFDQHNCTIIMGSWTSHGWQINFKLFSSSNSSKLSTNILLDQSSGWKLVDATEKRITTEYEEQLYISMRFDLIVKRNSPTFTAISVVPAVVIPLMLLVQFLLPVDHPQRLSIGFVSSILVFLEMLFLKMSLPKLGTSVPLIVKYYSQCFVMVIITVALSAILGRLSHPQQPLLAFPPPEIVKRILTGPVAMVLCLQSHASKVGLCSKRSEDGEILDENKAPSYSHEWLLIAKVLDRVACIVFVCIFVISLIAYVSPIK